MRLDLPNGIPHGFERERQPEKNPSPPLKPSSLERHRESLKEQAEHPRNIQRPVPEAKPDGQPSPEPAGRRTIPHDRRIQRNQIPAQGIGLSLRDEELKLLSAVARFRVVSTKDLRQTVYDNRPSRLERDLAYLREHKLVEVNAVQARRDGKRGPSRQIEVVTLTPVGRKMARQTSGLAEDQKLYSGLVKPREVEHDTQIYRAYLKEAERIERAGGTNLRVRLDFELKAEIQKTMYAERKANPERDLAEIKQQIAERLELPFADGSIQIPDARIEYDLDQGARSGHQDIEVLTAAYRPGHLRGKAQARFRLFASGADRATLSAKLEDDHHLLEQILEL
jgi:hypothetical protein